MNQTSRRIARVLRLGILIFCFVRGARRAKPAFVVTLEDRFAALGGFGARDFAPKLTDAFRVKRSSGSHEDVVAAVRGVERKLRRHPLVVIDYVISLLLRCSSGAFSRALDVYAVLVGSGKEIGLYPALLFVAMHSIRNDHRIEMTEMRQTVGVVDGSCDVESVQRIRPICHFSVVIREFRLEVQRRPAGPPSI